MGIINEQALVQCIRDAISAELQKHFKTGGSQSPQEEQLISKQELAAELGILLVTMTDWMKKGLPFLRLHKRVFFERSKVLEIMRRQTANST